MTDPQPIACPVCGSVVRVLATVATRGTTGTVFRCQRCRHKSGKLHLGPDDPDDVHRFVRKKLNALLKPLKEKTP